MAGKKEGSNPRRKGKGVYRASPRRAIEPMEVASISLLGNFTRLAKKAKLVDVSVTGFLLVIKRHDLIPKMYQATLTIDSLVGSTIIIYLSQMDLTIPGLVIRTKLLGKEGFEVGVDYSSDVPEYWRECLLDLLPSVGEFDEDA